MRLGSLTEELPSMPMLYQVFLIGELLEFKIKLFFQVFHFYCMQKPKNPTKNTTCGIFKQLLINNEAGQKQLHQNIHFQSWDNQDGVMSSCLDAVYPPHTQLGGERRVRVRWRDRNWFLSIQNRLQLNASVSVAANMDVY